jgi:hypothetical protein
LTATSQTTTATSTGPNPSSEVHTFVNDLERRVGTYLFGRRMYEVMAFWETALTRPEQPPVVQDFAEIWQAANSR